MCLKMKNKYTYLSMCSCCNIVSKFSSTVKKHLQKQHKALPATSVIPIRVENKYERKIKRTLDKANFNGSFFKKRNLFAENSPKVQTNFFSSNGRENERDKVKCAVCGDTYNDCLRYIHHLVTTHSNCDIKVSFICEYCPYSDKCCSDMLKHLEKKHKCKRVLSSLIDCINVEITSVGCQPTQKHCPYCEIVFTEAQKFYDHLRNTHKDNIENILISKQSANPAENETQPRNDLLIIFCCQSCLKSFHTVHDILEHIKVSHTQTIASSKPKRKRKYPKWMENDYEVIPIKISNNSQSVKTSNNDVLSVKEFQNSINNSSKKTCGYCRHGAETVKAFSRHTCLNCQELKLKASQKVSEVLKESDMPQLQKDVKYITLKSTNSLENNSLTFDKDVGRVSNNDRDIHHDFDGKDNESFGDSDDDYEPNNSDSNVSVTEDNFGCKERLTKLKMSTVNRRKLVKEHKEIAVNEKFTVGYKCPFCPLNLHNYEYMNYHVAQCHPEIMTHFKVDTKEVISTLQIVEDEWESFKCPNPNCDVVYRNKLSLLDHMTNCAEGKFGKEKIMCTLPRAWMEKLENSVSLICPYCQSVSIGKVNLKKHLQEHYPDKTVDIELNDTISPQQVKTDKWLDLECTMCPYCDFVTKKKIQLSKHIKRFHSNEICTYVVSCVLVDYSASKDRRRLIIKESENMSSVENKCENLETPRTWSDRAEITLKEEYIRNDTRHTVETDKNTDRVGPYELLNGSDDAKLDDINIMHSFKQTEIKEPQGREKIHENIFIQSTIPCGMYICPLCEFKTGIKKEIKSHIKRHSSKCNGDIDSIYTISDSWIKMVEDESLPFTCQLCDYKDVNLALAFRHVLSNHKVVTEPHSNPISSEKLYETVNVEVKDFKGKYEKMKYRCTTCVPGHVYKSRKGLHNHLKTRHTDKVSISVYETVYKMLDLISDSCNIRQTCFCCLCKKELSNISELEEHYKESHPHKLNKLLHKLNKSYDTRHDILSETRTCEVCCKQFTDEKTLKHHLILHMNRYKPTCKLCHVCFTNHAELECHNMEVHSKAGKICYICGIKHMKEHETCEGSSIKVLCQYCGTTLMGRNMKKHLVDKHINQITCECNICKTQEVSEGKKFVQCEKCKAVFCTWYVLRAHKYKEHGEFKGKQFKCRNCDMTFQSRHEQSLHSHKCGKLFDEVQTKVNLVDNDNSSANSGNITEVTVSEETHIDFSHGLAHVKLKYIIVDKQSQQPYTCKLCGKRFAKMRYICNHLRRMHTRDETKRYRCKICKMGFDSKQDFRKHCQTHINLRQYQCKLCNKMYKTAAHLKEHSEIHTLQTYSCEYCGLEFKQRGALLAHVVHHDKVKPLKCLYCNKGFTTHGDLQRHMNSYSKSSKVSGAKQLTFCNYCLKDFPNHKALVKHFQIHLTVNPFQCSVCQSKFASFREMYNHKSKEEHFTDSEKEAGKQDLLSPGNRFRKYQVSKSKMELKKANKMIANMEESASENALSVITDDQNIIEIEIDSSEAECGSRTKTVLDILENDMIKSMLDADPEILETVKFCDTDTLARKDKQRDGNNVQLEYMFEMQEEKNYHTDNLTIQDLYVAVRQDAYIENNISSQCKTILDNSKKMGSVIVNDGQHQETSPGKTQTFQASDGSIIHVCVLNHDSG